MTPALEVAEPPLDVAPDDEVNDAARAKARWALIVGSLLTKPESLCDRKLVNRDPLRPGRPKRGRGAV